MTENSVESLTELLGQTSVGKKNELSFAGRGLKLNTEEDAKEILEALNNTKTVHTLNLEGNTLGVGAAKAIAKALHSHPELKRAKWSDMFTGRLKSEIPEALRFLGSSMTLSGVKLVELDLSDNAFGPNGMEGLTEFLKSASCYTLRELRLNNNGLGIGGGKMLAKSLLECHRNSKAASTPLSLKVFISGRNRLENDGATALAEAFTAIGTLEEVSMPQNGINHPGISALAKAFAVNPYLMSVNLNDNTFTEIGAKSMAESLPKLQNLEVINFGDCLVRTKGAIALAKSLKDGHKKLKEFHLGFNEISREGAEDIAECLANKDELGKIDLDGNQFGGGIDLVREAFDRIGKLDLLGPLSDDEGSIDEDEVDIEEETEDDEAHKPSAGPSTDSQTVSVELFLKMPSRNDLVNLGQSPGQQFLSYLADDQHNINRCMEILMKVSSVIQLKDTQAQQSAFDCADAIMSNLFKSTQNEQSLLSNAILVHIGLIKSEEKIKPPNDLNGPLIVLNHVVQQNYFPKSVREIFNMFMSIPSKKFHNCVMTRDELLKTLNRM